MHIPCSAIYEAFGGYDSDGGKYDTVQRILARSGWFYRIDIDAWVPLWEHEHLLDQAVKAEAVHMALGLNCTWEDAARAMRVSLLRNSDNKYAPPTPVAQRIMQRISERSDLLHAFDH